MTFQEAVRAGLQHPVTFDGRASRSEYWYWVLFVMLAFFAAMFTVGFAASALDLYPEFLMLAWLLLALSTLSFGVRRLHDVGKSAWNLLWGLVPFGGIYLVVLYTQQGEQSPNGYGPPV